MSVMRKPAGEEGRWISEGRNGRLSDERDTGQRAGSTEKEE
jgi:hypothetical protein